MSGRPAPRPVVAASGARHGTLVLAALLFAVAAATGCAKADDVVATQPTTSEPTTNTGGGTPDTALAADVRGATTGTEPSRETIAPSSSSAPTTSPSVTTGAGPASTARGATTSSAVTTTATAPTGNGAPASYRAFCDRNARATDDFDHLDPTKDFGTYLAMLRRVSAELADLAPPAIEVDVRTVAEAFAAIKTAEQLDGMTHDLEVKAASDRVTAWAEKHCPQS